MILELTPKQYQQNCSDISEIGKMFDVIGQIKDLIKTRRIHIDDNVFTLHYRLSTFVLIFFTFVISSRKYFGDPIDCTVHTESIRPVSAKLLMSDL